MSLNTLPKPLLVFLVLFLGTIGIFFLQPPHRQCESQIDVLREQQKGKIFSWQIKGNVRAARIVAQIENCKLGNSPGACFELFSILRQLVRDLNVLPLECAEDLANLVEVRASLQEGLSLLAEIGWGEMPPEQIYQGKGTSWLEASDLALFCGLKDLWVRIFGSESMDELRTKILGKLPGEAPKIENGVCTNCEARKRAAESLDPEDLRRRSLFGLRCELYR